MKEDLTKKLESLIKEVSVTNRVVKQFQCDLVILRAKVEVYLNYHLSRIKNTKEIWSWLNKVYWLDRNMAVPVTRICKKSLKIKFTPDPKNIEIYCKNCGITKSRECTSWTSHDSKQRKCYDCIIKEYNSPEKVKERQQRELQIEENKIEWEKYKANWRKEIERLRSLPYKEYLQTEHWQEKRKRALRRSKYKCQLCNAGKKLDVHHRTYERLGHEEDSDLIALCNPCHAKFHDIEERSAS